MRSNQVTVFIGGAGHSGSTLLGFLLGSRDDAFYAGEASKTRFLGDVAKPARKRTCKLCGPACPIWSTFRPAAHPDLHEQLSRHVERPLIIDSAKGLDWLPRGLADVARGGGRAVLLFLTRDGRAVINSRVRKYPDRDPRAEIARWVRSIEGTAAVFEAHRGPKLRVRYEHLATAPEATLREICGVVGIDYRPSMLDFRAHTHHVLGGNNGTQFQVARAQGLPVEGPPSRSRSYYAEHPPRIQLDLRWHDELEPGVLALFERSAGRINRALAWPTEEVS